MKKIFLSVVAVMAIGTAAHAQDAKFGFKAGVNFATLGGDVEDANTLTGFHIGAVAEFKISEKFSIQPEFVYSMQGAKAEEAGVIEGFSYTAEGKKEMNYINIPVLAKIYVTEGLSIEAGPQVGILVTSKEKIDAEVSGLGSISETADVKEYTNSVDFGIAAGLAYDLSMGVFFQARYYGGLSNTFDGEGSDDYKVTNNVFSISVGYKF